MAIKHIQPLSPYFIECFPIIICQNALYRHLAPTPAPDSVSTLRSVKRPTSLPKLTRNKNEIDAYKK